MTAPASERIGVGNPMYCAPVDAHDPLLRLWIQTLRSKCPHFNHNADGVQPGCWFGLYLRKKDERDARLRAVVGFTYCVNNVVMVDAVLCEPTRAGRSAMVVLMAALREQWRSWNVRFFCELDNKRMRRMVDGLGAKPVALMYEIPAEEQR